MRIRIIAALLLLLTLYGALYAQRRSRRGGFGRGGDDYVPPPPNATELTEFVFARLMYPSFGRGYWGWRGAWSTDYPKADRQFLQGVRRLTRIHTRSMEEVVALDDNSIYDRPWIYAVEVGHWDLDDQQAAKLREYLLRGGFMMTDDFHGTYEWDVFMASMQRVFPDRPVVELEDSDALFHVLYDLDERFQVPGIRYFYSGQTYEQDGIEPRWRGILDDEGRLMVAICHNMDLGDAWEWADHPQYPEPWASLAYRIGVNYIIYAMTH
jgi:hypothetical protein